MSQPLFSEAKTCFKDSPERSSGESSAPSTSFTVSEFGGSAFRSSFYEVSFADSLAVREVCRLRYQVYFREYGWTQSGSDIDRNIYDDDADHLIIRSLIDGNIVGAYRLRCSTRTCQFSAQDEFDLSEILTSGQICVELSRAFVVPEHRHGPVLALLWKGIYRYLMDQQADLLFGLSSLKPSSEARLMRIIHYLYKKKRIWPDQNVRPYTSYDCSASLLQNLGHPDYDKPFFQRELPPLFRGYLNAGAKFCPVPAYDQEFNCYDLLTILETRQILKRYRTKFGK